MDEYTEGLCGSCISEFEKTNKCNRCGKNIEENSIEINKNFDESRFNEMVGE